LWSIALNTDNTILVEEAAVIQPLIDVLLATYNGERFLSEQLESLCAQSYRNFRLLVSDDGSCDATLAIVESFAAKLPSGCVRWVENPHRGCGPARNFEVLMSASRGDALANWVAFCDQDDVWLHQKLERLAEEMGLLEAEDPNIPCLVHTDLRVVDDQLCTIAPSFVVQQGIDIEKVSLPTLLSVNCVTGCAMMVNRALLDIALPIPRDVVMHDWWCALLSCAGRRSFIAESLVLYRQHGGNQIGAKGRSLNDRFGRALRDGKATLRRVIALGGATVRQATALEIRLRDSGRPATDVETYLRWRSRPLWARVLSSRCYYQGPTLDNLCRLLLW
jgi:glycosyltransferase involved in cell wall biosynthesis